MATRKRPRNLESPRIDFTGNALVNIPGKSITNIYQKTHGFNSSHVNTILGTNRNAKLPWSHARTLYNPINRSWPNTSELNGFPKKGEHRTNPNLNAYSKMRKSILEGSTRRFNRGSYSPRDPPGLPARRGGKRTYRRATRKMRPTGKRHQ